MQPDSAFRAPGTHPQDPTPAQQRPHRSHPTRRRSRRARHGLDRRYDDTKQVETFLLAAPEAEDSEMAVYSVQSPLGIAITGAKPGERRIYHAPSGTIMAVTLLHAVPTG